MSQTQGIIANRFKDFKRDSQIKDNSRQLTELKTLLNAHLDDNNKKPQPSFLQDRKHELLNPMKGDQITFTELRCIDKMKAMKRYKEK